MNTRVGEYGGHFWAPRRPMNTWVGEYGGHFWAPADR